MKIVNVMASSLDGRIGLHEREGDTERQAAGLSGQADQRFLRTQIEDCDAIIVGATSIRANEECLEHPGRDGIFPVWYILAQKPIPDSYPFWKQKHIPRLLVSAEALPLVEGSGVRNLVYGQENPVVFLHNYMASRHQCALLFGGGIVNNWFYSEGLVDELCLSIAPVFLAKEKAPFLVAPELPRQVNFSLLASQSEESFVFLRYKVRRSV